MRFDKAEQVDQIAYEMRLADWPRSQDRALINSLVNGEPPYSQEEAQKNGIEINVNFLEATRLAHDARMQFYGSFMTPGKFFTARTYHGTPHKRDDWSHFVTSAIAKRMKRSTVYYETFRSKFAMNVLHGIGPSGWDTHDYWCPDAYGIEDVLVPANTLLTMRNLPFFILYHSYTAPELIRLTRNKDVAKEAGWNLSLVDKCLEYLDKETMALTHNQWPEVWSPEKMGERVKGDGGFYAADSVPTIDCFDFYFFNDDDDEQGWCRRIILDAWSTPEAAGAGTYKMTRNNKTDFSRNQFLFNSKGRKVAQSWSNLVSWQFADLSAVAPFHYHTVRGLGYLLYAVGNLQNRLRCRFNEAVWESTLMYLRVNSLDEAERALKVELVNRGFVDNSVQFIPNTERFQINHQLVGLGLQENARIIAENTSSYVQDAARMGQDKTERTKFEVQARIQQMMSLIAAGQSQASKYQEFEYREIFRRFCQTNSRDPDIQTFRAECLAYGIPEKLLTPDAWDIESERVLGAGNKTLEMVIAEQLMAARNLYDPDSQRQILRDFTFAVTSDSGRADNLVPEKPTKVTDSRHDAQLASAALMLGLPVELKGGVNHIEYIEAMLQNFGLTLTKIDKAQGGNASPDQLIGLQNMAQNIAQHMQYVAQDKNEKERVAAWQKAMGQMMQRVKQLAQELQKKMQEQQQQGGGVDQETQAKIASMKVIAEAKAANTRESHAQRTAQRQLQWEQEMKQQQAEGQSELVKQNSALQEEIAKLKMQLQSKQQEHSMNLRARQAERGMELRARRHEHGMELRKKAVEDRLDLARSREEADIQVEAARREAKIKPKSENK